MILSSSRTTTVRLFFVAGLGGQDLSSYEFSNLLYLAGELLGVSGGGMGAWQGWLEPDAWMEAVVRKEWRGLRAFRIM